MMSPMEDRQGIDPNVWSGRALQVESVDLEVKVSHQCIRPLDGAFWLRAIMDSSASSFSLADKSQRTIRVTRFR